MFSQNDLLQIQKKGITSDLITEQLVKFKNGFPYLKVLKPAVYNNGILEYSPESIKQLETYYIQNKAKHTISKFVPASGAATRMFKNLYEYTANPALKNDEVEKFASNIKSFAFYSDLKNCIEKTNKNIDTISTKNIIEFLLLPDGLNYGNLPKGLLKFHSYEKNSRVPIEEHLVEGALYAKSGTNDVHIHFTISPEHIQSFTKLIENVVNTYETEFQVKYHISYSVQKASTDTIASDENNKPFREKDGTLIFRPGGHGALLENLNDLKYDVIFIKNIDNVVPDRLKPDTTKYKNALAGLLLQNQHKVSELLNELDNNTVDIHLCKEYIEKNLGFVFPENFQNLSDSEKAHKLKQILNRPIRVCGMVKNSGEPGGGPFWVQNNDGSHSLQILESSQFDLENENQKTIFKQATHFNPVDLVIFTKDYKGKKFDLTQFTDPNTGFISLKSKDGKALKALELPGLWNGAMANWNTIFVEVPISTFNPVKTVTDLLRDEHKA